MSLRKLLLIAAGAAMALSTTVPALAQEGMPPMGPPDEIKKMAAETVGNWDVVMKYKMDPSAADWMEAKGTAEFSTICDGAAVVMKFDSEMMGMPMHGVSTTVYDREAGEWVESWVDNMAARMSVYRGHMEGDMLITQGEDMMQGMKYLSRNTVFNRTPGRYEWKAEMSMDGGKTWMTWGTAVYTKKK